MADDYLDVVVGCVGGGSNFAGIANPFYYEGKRGKAPKLTRLVAVESTAAPSFTGGEYAYDFGDTGGMTPLLKMYTLGHSFIPEPIHAGGLRYHGKTPITSIMVKEGVVEARAHNQVETMEAGTAFLRAEGIVPAPESAHALRAVIDEAVQCRRTGEAKTILTLLSGHGYFDMAAYESYLMGRMEPFALPKTRIEATLREVRKING